MSKKSEFSARPSEVVPDGRAHRPITMFRWVVLGLVSFIAMLKAADRVALGITLPAIKTDLQISNAEAGLFATLLFTSFAIAQIPSSLACRRFGARNIMIVALLVGAASFYLIGARGSPSEINIYRSVLGVAEAAVSVCCIAMINQWFSKRESGTATGYYLGGTKLGPVFLPPLIVIILQQYGWQQVFQLMAVPVILSLLIWCWLARNDPAQSKFVSPSELEIIHDTHARRRKAPREYLSAPFQVWMDKAIRVKATPVIDTARGVFTSWNLIGNTIAYMFVIGIFNVFVAWIPTYLHVEKHIPMAETGVLASVLFTGAVAGNFVGGWLSDNILGRRRKPLMMLCTLFTAAALFGIIFIPANVAVLAVILLLTGSFFGLGYPHFTVYPMGLTTKEIYPLAFGFLNTGAALIGGLFPLVTGMLLDSYSWTFVFLFLSAASLASFGFLVTIQERLPEESSQS